MLNKYRVKIEEHNSLNSGASQGHVTIENHREQVPLHFCVKIRTFLRDKCVYWNIGRGAAVTGHILYVSQLYNLNTRAPVICL